MRVWDHTFAHWRGKERQMSSIDQLSQRSLRASIRTPLTNDDQWCIGGLDELSNSGNFFPIRKGKSWLGGLGWKCCCVRHLTRSLEEVCREIYETSAWSAVTCRLISLRNGCWYSRQIRWTESELHVRRERGDSVQFLETTLPNEVRLTGSSQE